MKSTTTLFALFLLCAFFTSYLPSATADVVFDMDGNPLQNGGTYYILPVIRGSGGGIKAAPTGKERCPLTVVQSRNELDKGTGIVLSSPLQALFIAEGYPLSIRFGPFPVITLCAGIPDEWAIVEGSPEGPAVKLATHDTVDGWFKIESVSHKYNDYKLVFCPQPADDDSDSKCWDIGIDIDDDQNRRLVVSKKNPLRVRFKKVESPHDEEPLAM